MEDFERQVTLENDTQSDTTIIRTERDDPNNWNDAYNNSHYSGYVWLGTTDTNDTIDYFCILSEEFNDLPNQGNSIILEMDYKCNEGFLVGLKARIGGIETFPLYNVNPSPDRWNKIYLNLGPRITDTPEASWFKFYIAGSTDPDKEAEYYFDNIDEAKACAYKFAHYGYQVYNSFGKVVYTTYSELVADILSAGKKITDFVRESGFKYGFG